MGEGIDHSGYAVPLVEPGELDQEQHDAVRDVFTVPGACTLVRADLFAEIGGFDEGIDYLLDDLSLCWRAHIAGARVIVAPDARVRHVQALGRAPDRRLAAAPGAPPAARAPQLLLAPEPGPRPCPAWRCSTSSRSSTRSSSAGPATRAGAHRRVELEPPARRTSSGAPAGRCASSAGCPTPRSGASWRGAAPASPSSSAARSAGERPLGGLAGRGRDAAGVLGSSGFRVAAGVWGVVGARAARREPPPAHAWGAGGRRAGAVHHRPDRPAREWASGWRTAGPRVRVPEPHAARRRRRRSASLFGGAMGLLRTVLTLGLIPIGAAGAYRLARPLGSRFAQIAALLAYLANPLPYDALAEGRWGVLALYAAAPTLVGLLARAAGVAPFGAAEGEVGPGVRARTTRQLVLAVGLLTAVVALVLPSVGAHRAGDRRRPRPGLGVGLPRPRQRPDGLAWRRAARSWPCCCTCPGASTSSCPGTPASAVIGRPGAGPRRRPGRARCASRSARSAAASSGWALLVAAALPLLIGQGERHAWAVRGWALARRRLGERLALPPRRPPVAAARARRCCSPRPPPAWPWRRRWASPPSSATSRATGSAGARSPRASRPRRSPLATLPVLGRRFDGRWSMPAGDHARALRFLDAENDDSPFRVLWLGDPSALPLGSWELTDGLAYATTDGGSPRLEDLVRRLRRRVHRAAGRRRRPGPHGPDRPPRPAPGPDGRPLRGRRRSGWPRLRSPPSRVPRPRGFVATLDAQLDLEPLDVPAGLTVYRNQAAFPMLAALPADPPPPIDGGISDAAHIDLSSRRGRAPRRGRPPALVGRGAEQQRGPLRRGPLRPLAARGRRPRAAPTASRSAGPPATVVDEGGQATFRYRTAADPLRRSSLVQALAWLWALRALVRIRLAPACRPPPLRASPRSAVRRRRRRCTSRTTHDRRDRSARITPSS